MCVTLSVHSVYKVHLHVSRYVCEKSVVKALYDTEVLTITYAAATTILTRQVFPSAQYCASDRWAWWQLARGSSSGWLSFAECPLLFETLYWTLDGAWWKIKMDSQSPFTSAGPDNATSPIERSSLQFCDSPLWDTALLWNTETPR